MYTDVKLCRPNCFNTLHTIQVFSLQGRQSTYLQQEHAFLVVPYHFHQGHFNTRQSDGMTKTNEEIISSGWAALELLNFTLQNTFTVTYIFFLKI